MALYSYMASNVNKGDNISMKRENNKAKLWIIAILVSTLLIGCAGCGQPAGTDEAHSQVTESGDAPEQSGSNAEDDAET